jgi:hypothetical protein
LKVTDEMNSRLTRPYSTNEVDKALNLNKPNKAPRPDGFTTGFYQLHWELMGNDITAAVLDFLNGGCNGTAQNYKDKNTKTITRAIKFPYLSSYNSGSPMKL